MLINEAKKQIQNAIQFHGAFSQNIVTLVLESVREKHGFGEYNQLIEEYKLTKIFGIEVKPVLNRYEVHFQQKEIRKVYVEVEAKDKDEALDIAKNGYQGRYGYLDCEWPDTSEQVISVTEENYEVISL